MRSKGRRKSSLMFRAGLLFLLAATPAPILAQVVPVPNPSFEKGKRAPEGWRLAGGRGEWLRGKAAARGRGAVVVRGDGKDASHWLSAPLALAPSALYCLTFQAREVEGGSGGGTAVSGPPFCNRDLGRVPEVWTRYTSVFMTPAEFRSGPPRLRFGQWHLSGAVAFDDVRLTAAQAVHRRRGDLVLGAGERLDGHRYTFRPPVLSLHTNFSRPLVSYRCGFNTDRATFGAGDQAVFRHHLAGRRHLTARITVGVTYHRAGALVVEAGTDGRSWTRLGRLDRVAAGRFPIPADRLPAEAIWVRLRAEGDRVSLQVGDYRFESRVDGPPLRLAGRTRFFAVTAPARRAAVTLLDLGDARPGGDNRVTLRIEGMHPRPLRGRAAIEVDGRETGHADLRLRDGAGTVRIPYTVPRTGRVPMAVTVPALKFRAESVLRVPELFRTDYGERLPSPGPDAVLWWASSGWKIPRRRPPPDAAGPVVRVRAARGEAEAVQLVVHAGGRPLRALRVTAGALTGPGEAQIPAEAIDLLRVAYVRIEEPTDPVGAAGLWPDPLPRFSAPVEVPAGCNQPIWIRVNVPRGDLPAGVYRGTLALRTDAFQARVRLEVEVYDFTLPERMTCTTAFGFSPGLVWRYHGLTAPAHRRAVLDRYFACLARHHLSPYDPAPLDPLRVTWPPRGETDPSRLAPRFDWTAWDRALTRAFGRYHFNSIRLAIPGLGGGSFHRRRAPVLRGHAEGTPEYRALFTAYCRALETHLREKGWLDEAFVYWFDEPEPKDYAFVMNGFRKLREAAPHLNRMLTEQPEPALVGGPNIWCPVTYRFDPDRARARRAAGDRIWWYVCTSPKAPYCTLFIDHPATEMRVWLWQTWKHGVRGVLVWATNYWTSRAAYPDPARPQNPYADPMSWRSGYSTPEGGRRPWGNGDGRFLYPPEAAADGRPGQPVLDPPVVSLRLEMLRDGLEDYEYLAMLERRLAANKDKLTRRQRARFARLLAVPESVTRSLTSFTTRPEPIEARRDAVARAIAALGRAGPQASEKSPRSKSPPRKK